MQHLAPDLPRIHQISDIANQGNCSHGDVACLLVNTACKYLHIQQMRVESGNWCVV